MFSEDDFLPISALQHLEFCPRQCGLIHLEGAWSESKLTAEGRSMHDKAHEVYTESRPGIRIARSLRLHSFALGLSGQADVVEFHELPAGSVGGVPLEGSRKKWQPNPVEYKRGRPKTSHCDIVQLCAQAICLEEMLGATIKRGALFYGKPRRRQDVAFTADLRGETAALAARLHELIRDGKTPTARYEKKCDSCSLLSLCMPKVTGRRKDIGRYLAKAASDEEGDG